MLPVGRASLTFLRNAGSLLGVATQTFRHDFIGESIVSGSIDYADFWYAEDGEILAGASDDALGRKEQELGVLLPDELKRLFMISDGGVPLLGLGSGEERVDLPVFFDVDSLEVSKHDGTTDYDYEAVGIPEGIVVLGSHGHDYYALDYRSGPSPAVIYGRDDGQFGIVAESFREFLSRLTAEETDAEDDTSASWKLVHQNTLASARTLVERFGLDWRSEYDLTLCQLAASDGALTTLKCLIDMGADPAGSLKLAEANKKNQVADYLRSEGIV